MDKVVKALKPRKSPIQARSLATVDALHTATIQVLTREGLSGCTTTAVAMRAGMSVGSLYQYYPNRDALLAAVLDKHLDNVATSIEKVCAGQHGQPAAAMASELVKALIAAKLSSPDESRALYAAAADRGGAQLAARAHARLTSAIEIMLASAPDVQIDDPATTATIALNAMMGPVRACLEGQTEAGFESRLTSHLTRLLTAYLHTP